MYFLYITFYTIYTYTSYIFLAENSSVIVALNAEKMGWWAVQHNGEGHGLRWAEWELGWEGLQFQFCRRHLITREEQTAGGIQENSWHQDAQPEETGERTGYTPGRTVRNTEHRSKELGHIAWPVWILGLGWILTTGWENLQSRQANGAGFEYDRAKGRDVSLTGRVLDWHAGSSGLYPSTAETWWCGTSLYSQLSGGSTRSEVRGHPLPVSSRPAWNIWDLV